MILSGESYDDQHDDDEDKADGIFFLEETFGTIGNFISNVFDELTLLIGHGVFLSSTGHACIVEHVNFFNCHHLDDSPNDAKETADANDNDLPLIGEGSITCASGDQQMLKPIVNPKHINQL